MNQLFKIVPEKGEEIIQPVLNIKTGRKHFSYAITDAASDRLKHLSYYTSDEINAAFLADLFNQVADFKESFYQIKICYDYPGNIIAPSAGLAYENANRLKQTLYGATAGYLTITELLAEWQLYNIYTVPGDIHVLLTEKFPAAWFRHQTTIGLINTNAAALNGCLQIDFRQDDFSLIAVKAARLLLAETYEYSTPEDVIYCLLNTCKQFELMQNTVQLHLSGLIDKQSALYKDLYQYFLNIDFRDTNWGVNGNEYPAHFFTSLNDLSKCVL